MPEFEVRRSATIEAPASVVYARLIDFRRWAEWSPWQGLDSNVEQTYSEPSSGVGATMAWTGNRKAGTGRMEITRATTDEEILLDLVFEKPFKAENVTRFVLASDPDGTTRMDWIMTGRNDTLFSRIFAKVMSMDKMVGGDFEKGLAALKEQCRAEVTAQG